MLSRFQFPAVIILNGPYIQKQISDLQQRWRAGPRRIEIQSSPLVFCLVYTGGWMEERSIGGGLFRRYQSLPTITQKKIIIEYQQYNANNQQLGAETQCI